MNRLDQKAMLQEALSAADEIAKHLNESILSLTDRFPITAQSFQFLERMGRMEIDAFQKRFEQLADLLNRRLFRLVLELEMEEWRTATAREHAVRLANLGAIADPNKWSDVVQLRNILTHEYPMSTARHAERLNAAWVLAKTLLSTRDQLNDYILKKGLLP